ncbi:MAG TPA: hypothetical protein VNA28_08340 [Solirubrobacteraceae bacterium]|nr:hypothetical protein [Solirubrobacteraceae bacterium]
MSDEPAELLSAASLGAAVDALAERNRHHLESMTEDERAEAVLHWRELAAAVLTAASTAERQADGDAPAEGQPGRALIVLEDVGDDGIAVQATFDPELQDLGNGEVAGTAAQIAAIELLDALGSRDETDE